MGFIKFSQETPQLIKPQPDAHAVKRGQISKGILRGGEMFRAIGRLPGKAGYMRDMRSRGDV
jgi:hypothetical protein